MLGTFSLPSLSEDWLMGGMVKCPPYFLYPASANYITGDIMCKPTYRIHILFVANCQQTQHYFSKLPDIFNFPHGEYWHFARFHPDVTQCFPDSWDCCHFSNTSTYTTTKSKRQQYNYLIINYLTIKFFNNIRL